MLKLFPPIIVRHFQSFALHQNCLFQKNSFQKPAPQKRRHRLALALIISGITTSAAFATLDTTDHTQAQKAATPTPASNSTHPPAWTQALDSIKPIVHTAFLEAHAGYSVDETLIQPRLRQAFLIACQKHATEKNIPLPEDPIAAEQLCNAALLQLRKTGQIGQVTIHRAKQASDAPAPTHYQHAVEIAARYIQDTTGCHTDDILTDPIARTAYLNKAHQIAGDLPGLNNSILLRRAISLRKARKLRPELVTRIAEWGRQISEIPLVDLQKDITHAPKKPGIYLFRDETGYLYIGEARNLRTRLQQHLAQSSNTGLCDYLHHHQQQQQQAPTHSDQAHTSSTDHFNTAQSITAQTNTTAATTTSTTTQTTTSTPSTPTPNLTTSNIIIELHAFDPKSSARLVDYRRAYESDLIASRKPRFNVRP